MLILGAWSMGKKKIPLEESFSLGHVTSPADMSQNFNGLDRFREKWIFSSKISSILVCRMTRWLSFVFPNSSGDIIKKYWTGCKDRTHARLRAGWAGLESWMPAFVVSLLFLRVRPGVRRHSAWCMLPPQASVFFLSMSNAEGENQRLTSETQLPVCCTVGSLLLEEKEIHSLSIMPKQMPE